MNYLKNDLTPEFEKYDLKFLRLYAKNIGVKCPCGKTKVDLIQAIKDVENGRVQPVFTKRGRPVYGLNYIQELNKFYSGDVFSKNERVVIEDIKKLTKDYIKNLNALLEKL